MRKFQPAILSVLIGGLLAGMFYAADVWSDRQYVVEVVSPEPLYSIAPSDYPEVNPVRETLLPGQAIRVLRVR